MPKKEIEPAEVAAIEAETMSFDPDAFNARGDARDCMLGVLRASMDWGKLSENQQRDINAAVDVAAQTIIKKLVRAIASEGRETVVAKLVSVTVKDEIKLALTCGFTHENVSLLLSSAPGHTVQLVMADASAFDHQAAPARVDPDQPDIFIGPEGDTDLVDAADEPTKVHDVEINDAQ